MCCSNSGFAVLIAVLSLASRARILPLVLTAEIGNVTGTQKSPRKGWDLRFPKTQTGEFANASKLGYIDPNKILMSP